MSGSDMKAVAKRQLKGQWINAIVIMIISGLILGAVGLLGTLLGPFAILVTMAVNGPFTLGITIYYQKVIRGENAEIGDVFKGFGNFAGAFVLIFLNGLFIFLWSLLLVIPGIMKSYSYAMAFYILADNPEMSAMDALKQSQTMMKGHRMELFVLQFSFIGWFLLGTITFGLGNFYTIPYMSATIADFYCELSGKYVRVEEPTSEGYENENQEVRSAIASAQVHRDTEVLSVGMVGQTTVLNQNMTEGTFTGLQGGFEGVGYMLDDGVEYSIGRDGDVCGIVVDDGNTSISRLHCTIRFVSAQNGYYVTDQSSNGTFANGERLVKGEARFVSRGTVITLGDQTESFRLD